MGSLWDQHKDFLSNELSFKNRVIVSQRAFVHIKNIAYNGKLMYHINRRFDNLIQHYKCKCDIHNGNCRLLEKPLAFTMYLDIIEGTFEEAL